MTSMDRHSQVWLEAVPLDETRSDDGTDRILRVRGYAIVFNSESERMGSVIETIDPSALDHLGDLNALAIRMQGEHEGLALANSAKGTLRLAKDDRGVLIEADLDARRSDARNLYYGVERGDVDKMSFGFRIAPGGERITEDEDGTIRAHVTRIDRLYEVSGVNFPAYRDTSLEAVAGDDDESIDPADDEDEDASEERSIDAGFYERAMSEFDAERRPVT
jgi:HK97 family phage prohead protease